MDFITINMNKSIEGVSITPNSKYLDFQNELIEDFSFNLTDYKNALSSMKLHKRLDLIFSSIGICSKTNCLYSLMTELTKLIPFIQNNYNLLSLGESGLGKSAIYSTVFPFENVCAGVPTPANLRGDERNSKNTSLDGVFNSDLLVLEEVVDSQNSQQSIPILKTFLSSGEFKQNNKNMNSSKCSIVVIGNDYSTISNYTSIKTNNILNSLPNSLKDNALLSRFNGVLPHYESILGKRNYTSGEGIHCQQFHKILKEMRTLENQSYFDNIIDFSDRNIRAINTTVNGFVKLLVPTNDFLEFIKVWAIHINSLNDENKNIHLPFNASSIPFVSNFYFKDRNIKWVTFLSDSRLLFKFHDNASTDSNASIIALDGFGITQNQFDLEYIKDNPSNDFIPLTKVNDLRLDLNIDGDIVTSKKYSKEGKQLPNTENYEKYNLLLLREIAKSVMLGYEVDPNLKFEGIPNFYIELIQKDIKKKYNSKNDIPKSCLILKDGNVKLLNLHRFLAEK